MREVYRKRGNVLRYEHETLVRAAEAGEAVEENGHFRCRPWSEASRLPELDDGPIRDVVNRIRAAIPRSVEIERLIVTDGIAEHELEGRKWSDSRRRIHLSLTRDRYRVLLDEGSFDAAGIERVAALLARLGPERHHAPTRVRLAPRVVAALTTAMVPLAPPNVTIEQVEGGIDGKGLPIGRAVSPPWPNWYRPSYRVRPIRAPLNLTSRCTVTTVEPSLPEAVALLAPPDDELLLRVLCADGKEVFAATLRVIRIDAISDRTIWYPLETGIWAGEAEVA